jgi:glycosyltransferase involved in cell wall biosynthesis
MRILFITPNLPYPPQSGSGLRAYGLIRGLKTMARSLGEITIDLLAFHDKPDIAADSPLDALCENIKIVHRPARSTSQRLRLLLTTSRADMASRLDSDDARQALERLFAGATYDAAIYIGLETAIYMQYARGLQPSCRQIYDAANVEHLLQKRISQVDRGRARRIPASVYSSLQIGRILRAEQELCATADAVVSVSEEDARQLRDLGSPKQLFVVPNGIFVEDYAGESDTVQIARHALVFTGKMDYRPNVDAMQWFARDIFSRVLERVPDARLYVVGQKPHASLSDLTSNPAIELTGWVPSVVPFLKSACVFVTPLRMGSGTRLKLLEAMAASCPIVSTRLGAEGLSSEALAAMALADDAPAFAGAVVSLMGDAVSRSALGERAFQVVSKQYDWSVIIPQLETCLESLSDG